MSVAHDKIRLEYDDYLRLSEHKRGELIDGDFIASPSPSFKHQRISIEIGSSLNEWVEEHHLGVIVLAPMDVKFSEYDVTQPDILFVSKNREGIIEENYIGGAPDLIVEILSPSNKQMDLHTKLLLYSKFGVREYWIVDPIGETIAVYDFDKSSLMLRQTFPKGSSILSKVIEGFRLDTSKIFY